MKRFLSLCRGMLAVCALSLAVFGLVACNQESGTKEEITFQAENLNVKLGSEVNWTEGVTATTKDGQTLTVTADASGVDLQKAGTYPIIFSAGKYSVERIVRVYGMPTLYYVGEPMADGQSFMMNYTDLAGERGFASGVTAKDCFGMTLDVEMEAPEYTGGAGPFSVIWKTQDAAGNALSVSGTVTLDAEKFPTAQDATYDLSQEYAEIVADTKGGERVFLYEGETKINLKYYERTEEGFLLSGAYLSKGETGERQLRIETEFGSVGFTVNVTDAQPVRLKNVSQMNGYLFLQGEPIRIELPDRLCEGYQKVDIEFSCNTLQFALTSDAFEVKGTPAVGEHRVTVTATGPNNTDEKSFVIKVCSEEEYYADYGSGDTDQFLDRFYVDTTLGMSFTYETLDEAAYGVTGAYRFKSSGDNTWNQRLELRLSTTRADVSRYDTVEFDVWVNSGKATFPFLIIDPDKYIVYTVMEKDTQTVVDKTAVQAGKWYHMTAAVPDGAKSLAATNICLADAGEIVDLYIRNVQLCKAEAPFLTSVGCKAVITKDAEGIAGRTDVYKYVSTDTAWNSRAQFTKETYAKYNALYENGGGKMTMDICFTGTVNAIQFWGIQGGAMPDFTSSSSPKAVWKDAEGNVVAPEKIVANTWYTLELDVNAIGKLDISNNDRGLQFATLSDNGGVFYIDNVQFIPAA